MATARTARLRPLARTLAAALVGAGLLVAAAPGTSAAPQLTLRDAKARVAALNARAERITESYNAAREQLRSLQAEQRSSAARLRADQRVLAEIRQRISATASAAYRAGGFTTPMPGFDDPQAYLDQASILEGLSRVQAEDAAQAAAEAHTVAADQALYNAKSAQVRGTLATISTQRHHIDALLAQAQHVLGSLRAADQARLAAQQAQETAQQTALRSSYSGPADGRGAIAVRFAYAQLGKPYVYGAAGPDAYDCSGLTMRAWGAAGVGMPHNAAMQQAMFPAVSISALQPGDLVFFGSPASHEAMYVGGGQLIEAPHTGDVVKLIPLSYMPTPSGAVRP